MQVATPVGCCIELKMGTNFLIEKQKDRTELEICARCCCVVRVDYRQGLLLLVGSNEGGREGKSASIKTLVIRTLVQLVLARDSKLMCTSRNVNACWQSQFAYGVNLGSSYEGGTVAWKYFGEMGIKLETESL